MVLITLKDLVVKSSTEKSYEAEVMAYEFDWNIDGNKWNRLPRRFATREELWVVVGQFLEVMDPKREAKCIELKLRKVE